MSNSTYDYDVIVVGGGTAGWVAAMSAARMNRRVLLVERKGYLGGVLCTGIPIHGFYDSNQRKVVHGYADEFVRRLESKGESLGYHMTDLWFGGFVCVNPAAVTPTIIDFLTEAGVEMLFYSQVTGVLRNGSSVEGVVVQEKTRKSAHTAPIVVDASGDAIVSHLAGAETQVSDALQPPTLIFRLQGVDIPKLRQHLKSNPGAYVDWRMNPGTAVTDKFLDGTQFFYVHPELVERIQSRGSYSPIINRFMFTVTPDGEGIVVNMLRARHVDGKESRELTKASVHLYANLEPLVRGFRDLIPGFERCFLAGCEPDIQLRETMRIIGRYTLTLDDVVEQRSFDDSIALGGYFIDIHSASDNAGLWRRTEGHYGIPYRSLIPAGLNGLLCAGRCISGTKEAAASYRVMATCMAMGQAAGNAAAMCSHRGISPHELPASELRRTLLDQSALVDVNGGSKVDG